MQYEIDSLRRICNQKDQIISHVDLTKSIIKVDKIIKGCEMENTYDKLLNQNSNSPPIQSEKFRDQYSMQPYILVEKLKTLENHINFISLLFDDKEVKSKIKQKSKAAKSTSNIKGAKASHNEKDNMVSEGISKSKANEERDLLIAEKNRLESYLKVYSQRINSLSTVVLSYQNQLKGLQDKLKEPGILQKITNNANHSVKGSKNAVGGRHDDDDNESFAQYDLESDVGTLLPLNPPQVNIMNEIIGYKNTLIQAQQEELDNLKNEIVKGTSVYVLMTASEKCEWDKYRAIGSSFTLIDKLRESVPINTKWVDKNIHKVIQSAIELYELEKANGSTDINTSLKNLKSKQEYLIKMINDVENMNKSKTTNFGKNFTNYYAIILALLNEN